MELDGELLVEIEDNGPGLSELIKDHLFEPFITTKTNGTGLGLYLSRRIVDDHGGRLEMGSGNLGGALFRVVLPSTDKTQSGSLLGINS